MGLPEEAYFDDVLPLMQSETSVLDTLSRSSDVLDLLRRADSLTPPEIDLWAALVVGAEPRLYVHAPRQPSPTLTMALADSMRDELSACTGQACEVDPTCRRSQTSCVRLEDDMLHDLCDVWRDHVTQSGDTVVGVSRAAATDTRSLTLDRWRQADEVLEVSAWMLGTLGDSEQHQWGVTDPITGAFTQAFFQATLEQELNRQMRVPAELTLAIIQLRNSSVALADQPVPPAALAHATDVVARTLRKSDVVARLDGRRLGVLFPGTSPRHGLMAATRMGEAMRGAKELEGWSVDIGVSGLGMQAAGCDELISQAMQAMDAAEKGRADTPFVYL